MATLISNVVSKTTAFELMLNLDLTSTLDSRITFTRASMGTYLDSAGVVRTAAVDVPRFDYHPTTLAPRGLLSEMQQRTNICLQSNDFGHATAWGTNAHASASVVRTGNAALAPDGTMSACLVALTRTATGQHALIWNPVGMTTVTGQYTASVWLKAKDATSVGKTITLVEWFTITQGNKLVTLTADWVRHDVLITNAGNRTDHQIRIGYDLVGPANAQLGLTEFYVWGAQFEAGTPVSALIPTTTAAVTRAADSAVMTGTNFSSWYNVSAGTFVMTFDVGTIATGVRGILSADNNTSNAGERVCIYQSAAVPRCAVQRATVTQAELGVGTLTANTEGKAAISFALNDVAFCFNGSTVAVDTVATMPAPFMLNLGTLQTALNPYIGHIREIKFFKVAKSDAELQALTV